MTGTERILNAHATKTLDEALLELSLLKGGKVIATGEGKLSESADGRLKIEVSAAHIPFIFNPLMRGVIIPDHEFCDMTATASDNVTVAASKIYAKSISHKENGAQAIFEPRQIKLWSPINYQPHSSFEVFMTPFEWDFANFRCAEGEINPVFGDHFDECWFFAETDDAAIGLRKDSDSWVHLKINSKVADANHAEKCAVAFIKALRFHSGTHLDCLAQIRTTNQMEEITLFDQKPNNERRFYKPLPPHEFQATEKLLMSGMGFFLKESSDPVYLAVSHCWESRKLTFLPGCLLVCSVVEGLADYIVKDANEQHSRLRELALELLRKELNAKDNPYLDEFGKYLMGTEFFKGKESIKKSGELLKIVITPVELKAWGQLRHRLAHGNFSLDMSSQSTIQSEIDGAAYVANIVNKFVLGLIRYEGVFCDYSVKGHPTCQFPSCAIVPSLPNFF